MLESNFHLRKSNVQYIQKFFFVSLGWKAISPAGQKGKEEGERERG